MYKNKKIAIDSYKKQHGLHHKVNKTYGQIYWPYLPILLITFIGIITGLLLVTNNNSTSFASITKSSILNQTNNLRQKYQLGALTYSKDLGTAAQLEANEIAITNSWANVTQARTQTFNLITTQMHNLSGPKENLAYGFSSSSSILSAWNSSNYQSANMLNSNMNSIGIGIVNSPSFNGKTNTQIVVAVYAHNRTIPPSPIRPTINNRLSLNTNSLAVIKFGSIIQVNYANGIYIALTLIVVVGVYLTYKHVYKLHRWIRKGEDLFIAHPLIDIGLIMLLLILASSIQSAGYIS
jgi:uncharacterized protein YkwD